VTPAQLLAYLGPALIYALAGTGLAFLLLRAATSGRADGWRPQARHARVIGLVAFFLILTQHPFPDRDTLDCSQGGAQPILQPFATLSRFALLWERGGGLRPWLGDKMVQASTMNFVLCLLIGLAIARHLRGRLVVLQAFLCGAALSLTAELLQLTAFLGFYPCPYRQFEVDDLILNISGVMAGVALARLLWNRSRRLP